MTLHFSPVDTPLRDLQVWHAESDDYSFTISQESRNGRGLDESAFLASWQSKRSKKPAVAIDGSPFATFEKAEKACEHMLSYLSASR